MANKTVNKTVKPATKKPTGLYLERDKFKITANWKIGDADYGAGQQAKHQWSTQAKYGSNDSGVGGASTQKSYDFNIQNLHPLTGGRTLTFFKFKVRGRRKKWKTQKKEKNKTTNTTHIPNWSSWVEVEGEFAPPPVPTVNAEWDSTASNRTKFTWSVAATDKDEKQAWETNIVFRPYTRYHWVSLVYAGGETDGSKIPFNSESAVHDTDDVSTWAEGFGTVGQSGELELEGERTFEEDTDLLSGGSYTRWIAVQAQGVGGDSAWAYARHTYATPNAPDISGGSASTSSNGTGYDMSLTFATQEGGANPIDSVGVEYAMVVPNIVQSGRPVTPDTGHEQTLTSNYEYDFSVPTGTTWETVDTIADTGGNDKVVWETDTKLVEDQVLFLRAVAKHDNNTKRSKPRMQDKAPLKAPTIEANPNYTTYRVEFTVTNPAAEEVPADVYLYMFTDIDKDGKVVGVIPHGSTSLTVKCPSWEGREWVNFGARARIAVWSYKIRTDTGHEDEREYKTYQILAESPCVVKSANLPKAPTNVVAKPTNIGGTVRVEWDWSWQSADGAEVAWADHDDAWESTDEPETYEISNLQPSFWNVSNLETGKKWYFRVRLFQQGTDKKTYSPWSDISDGSTIDLASAPSKPFLTVSKSVLTPKDKLTCAWVYSTTDGTNQGYAEIAEVTTNNGVTTYNPIAHATSEQYITINASRWRAGQTVRLAVSVMSESGRKSDEWSDPVPVSIATAPTCSIVKTSPATSIVPVQRTRDDGSTYTPYTMVALPAHITVNGAKSDGKTILAIERDGNYPLDRPDGTTYTGFSGETIYRAEKNGAGQFEIALDDLIGQLDDGAKYVAVATVKDSLGQTAGDRFPFEVHWNRQAKDPVGSEELNEQNVSVITVGTPEGGAGEGDYVNIYRLSADKPELIYEKAEFGQQYVDPYPTIGEFGGHRLVYTTIYGDYITGTEPNGERIAYLDVEDPLYIDAVLFDFEGDRVQLNYGVSVNHSWSKDFTETKYLGGAVQGDWNLAVGRTAQITASLIHDTEADTIESIRRLATYAGVCHVRTPDGSCFSADVQVAENNPSNKYGEIVQYTFTITRVDAEELDGMTLAEWIEEQQEEEEEP